MGHPHCEAPAVRARRWSLAALPLLAGRLHGRFLGLETSAWQYILCFPITCCVFHPRLISRGFESCLARNLFGSLQTWLDSTLSLLFSGLDSIAALIAEVLKQFPGEEPVNENWIISPYAPTPTIIEAARSLYENHSVEDIIRHEADGASTDRTIECIREIIQTSKEKKEKSICFVTGVPGAGKTLVGLEVAIKQTSQSSDQPSEDEQAVYLSGNGPLVAVLTLQF